MYKYKNKLLKTKRDFLGSGLLNTYSDNCIKQAIVIIVTTLLFLFLCVTEFLVDVDIWITKNIFLSKVYMCILFSCILGIILYGFSLTENIETDTILYFYSVIFVSVIMFIYYLGVRLSLIYLYVYKIIISTVRKLIFSNKYVTSILAILIIASAGSLARCNELLDPMHTLLVENMYAPITVPTIPVPSICVGKLPVAKFDPVIYESPEYKLVDLDGDPIIPGDDYLDEPCHCETDAVKKKNLYQLKEFQNIEEPVIYHACWKNNLSALMRMLLQMPRPDEVVLKEFELWFDKVFEREFKPVLYNFNYCHKAWFNHLCKKKQVEVAPYYPEINPIDFIPISIKNIKEYNTYTNFVKSEKQCGNGCKTRCICSPGPAYKYIMGPITYDIGANNEKAYTWLPST